MNLEFYKNKFEREQKRRVDLDNAMNLPILVSTLIMGLNSYVIKDHNFNKVWNFSDLVVVILLAVSGILIIISSYYIFLAVNNIFKGFDYPNFELMQKYRDIEIFDKNCDVDKRMDIEEIITNKIIKYSDESTIINEKRGVNLFNARRIIILNFIVTILNIIIVTSRNLLK